MACIVLVAAAILAAAHAGVSTKKAVSAAIKDTSVNGIEGVNLVWNAPFKIDDYIVGFKYSLAKLGHAPDVIFARRDFSIDENMIIVQTDLDMSASQLAVFTQWCNGKCHVSIEGNTADKLTMVAASSPLFDMLGYKIGVFGDYSLKKKIFSTKAEISLEDADADIDWTLTLKTDTKKRDLTLFFRYRHPFRLLSKAWTYISELTIREKKAMFGLLKKYRGGSVQGTVTMVHDLDFKLGIVWKDEGVNGIWTTTAEVPLSDRSKSKVSLSRDWNY